MILYIKFTVFLAISTTSYGVDLFPEVSTKSGVFQGLRRTIDGFDFEEFLGIRYADFVGRFKKGKYPASSPDGVINATSLGNRCYQPEYITFPFHQEDSEDCLNLNVYVPWGVKRLGSRRLPVVIGIHGGGFEVGSAAVIPGGELLSVARDVIFVSIQYRLGIWGLLTTGDDVSPGNLLYWDQHYAIRWVHDNIESFGGDPSLVTVWGFSAGGSSSAAQVFFKGNQGLIRRAIPVSAAGAYFLCAEHSCRLRKSYIQHGKNVAVSLGCPSSPSWAMLECLSEVDNARLLVASNTPALLSDRPVTERWFPVIDGEFIDDVPYQLYSQGRTQGVDFMHGFGQHDAGYFLLTWMNPPEDSEKQTLYEYWSRFYSISGVGDPQKLLEDAKIRYGEETVELHPLTAAASQRENDRLRVTPHILDVKYQELLGGSSNNYVYVMNHRSSYSHSPQWMTGDHLDTCLFSFGLILGFPELFNTTDEEKELSRDMIRYQFNFAKTGNPNLGSGVPTVFPTWNMNSRRLLRFQSSSEGGYQVVEDAYKGIEDFWEPYTVPKEEIDKEHLCIQP